ncbi:hypothetical protein [Halobaculum sp. D14]|uniref:hypothetical protein n=1 Tax=unclassified Halobaculum TaxID=2640896 RepID=UPI003EBDA349
MVEFTSPLIVGLLLDMTGALLMAGPDLPLVQRGFDPELIEEGRNRLVNVGHLGADHRAFDAVMGVVADAWDGTVERPPTGLVVDDHPGRPRPTMCLLYTERPETLDRVSIRTRLDADDFDWVAPAPDVYDWLGESVTDTRQRSQRFRGVGAVILAVGYAIQIGHYVLPWIQ